MAQFIVITTPRSRNVGAYCHGHVVAVLDDAHQFSPLELSHAFWRVVSVPGLPVAALDHLRVLHTADKRPGLVLDVSVLARIPHGQRVTLTPRQAWDLLTTAAPR